MSPISFIGTSTVFFNFLIKFFQTNRIAPDGTPRNILGYSVCQCPIKGRQAYIGLSENRQPELFFKCFICVMAFFASYKGSLTNIYYPNQYSLANCFSNECFYCSVEMV